MTIPFKKWNFAAALTAVVLVAAVPGFSPAAEQPKAVDAAKTDATMAKIDKDSFVSTVASAGKFEIDSSKLALDKAKSKDVKMFARMMIKDHTKAGKRLAAILKKEDAMAPADTLSPQDDAAMKQLTSASDADFEKTYVTLQTKAHQDAVALFKSYSADPDDKKLGRFAKNTLPTLEKHLQHVQALTVSQ
jgi:putative membrane protein